MVSVKRFILDEPALFSATEKFVQSFSKVPDPVIAVAAKASSPEAKIAWTLLGTDLFQDRTCYGVEKVLVALFEAFPDDKLWTLPVPTAARINEVIERALDGEHWSLFEHVAGIFWSVGFFVRRHPDLVAWVEGRTPEEIWRDLGEIYFMGKSKPRIKANAAIYRLVAPAPAGLGMSCRKGGPLPPLPLTMGARRFLAILGPAKDEGFSGLDPAEKQKLVNAYCTALSPGNPYLAAHALQFFLEDGEEDFVCRERTSRCSKCALYEYCDYAEHKGDCVC